MITEDWRQSVVDAKDKCKAAEREEIKLVLERDSWVEDVEKAMEVSAKAWVMNAEFAPGSKISVIDKRSGRSATKSVRKFVKAAGKATVYIENGGYFQIDDGHVNFLATWFMYNPSYKEILYNLRHV